MARARAVSSIGGQAYVCRTVAVVPGTESRAAAAPTASFAHRMPSAVGDRISTCNSASGQTMLMRLPALAIPTLTVTSLQRPFSRWQPMRRCAAASAAFAPRSGSIPAWAARPVTVTRRSTTPFGR